MHWVKIHIPDRAQSGVALIEMSGHGRIDCYEGDIYVVPEPALGLLTDLDIRFVELGRFGRDQAETMLRDTVADYAQRWHAREPGAVPSDAR